MKTKFTIESRITAKCGVCDEHKMLCASAVWRFQEMAASGGVSLDHPRRGSPQRFQQFLGLCRAARRTIVGPETPLVHWRTTLGPGSPPSPQIVGRVSRRGVFRETPRASDRCLSGARNYARAASGNPKAPSLADNYMQLSHFHQVSALAEKTCPIVQGGQRAFGCPCGGLELRTAR
ncbi:hypothetical protein HPB50_000194 [Hyalomma asiaticum]|uniref:Uncharacterized protein n=1 Tax=Hyalomma asiaticum TaxID=266040 RepID=A0ACB7S6Z2_HYAAI|nr:hypothetical protein HPB50_000194 [Hyalomma asiaticum]